MTTPVKSLRTRLQAVQDDITPVLKESTNPHFRSKFADIQSILDMLRPLLQRHGVTVLQPLSTGADGTPALRTIVTCDTGETIEGVLPIPANADPQKLGGWITYMRRYSLQAFFVLPTADLDAEDVLRPTGGGNVFKPGSGATSVSTSSTKQWQKGGK